MNKKEQLKEYLLENRTVSNSKEACNELEWKKWVYDFVDDHIEMSEEEWKDINTENDMYYFIEQIDDYIAGN